MFSVEAEGSILRLRHVPPGYTIRVVPNSLLMTSSNDSFSLEPLEETHCLTFSSETEEVVFHTHGTTPLYVIQGENLPTSSTFFCTVYNDKDEVISIVLEERVHKLTLESAEQKRYMEPSHFLFSVKDEDEKEEVDPISGVLCVKGPCTFYYLPEPKKQPKKKGGEEIGITRTITRGFMFVAILFLYSMWIYWLLSFKKDRDILLE